MSDFCSKAFGEISLRKIAFAHLFFPSILKQSFLKFQHICHNKKTLILDGKLIQATPKLV